MDLDQLHFSPAQLADLYRSNLVLVPGKEQAVVLPTSPVRQQEAGPLPAAPAAPVFMGRFEKKILWVIHAPGQAYLADADFEFLSQILTACKLNMDDVALLNNAAQQQPLREILEQLQPKAVLFCGVPHTSLPFAMQEYLLYPHQQRQYFVSDELSQLRNDKTSKSKLWLALKEILAL